MSDKIYKWAVVGLVLVTVFILGEIAYRIY